MKKSHFTELFNTPSSRLIEFLICGREFDYSVLDMNKATGINDAKLSEIISYLLSIDFVVRTRRFNKRQMYKINLNDSTASYTIGVFDSIVKRELCKPKML
jgi:hypothetical protein